ncbi:MAG: asparagine synthase-related protein, partial [Chrysiogenia bacterium]
LIGLKKLLSNKLPEIDNESLIHFYHFRQTCNNSTLLKNVKKLEPGYSLKISNDGFQLIKYFDVLSYFNCDFNFDFKYTVQNINELLEKSINNRMSNDKDKLGLTISGGLDSGFIAKLLHKNKIDFTGFNLGYKDLYNEYKRLNQLRKFYQLNINKIIIDFDSIINSIEFANKFTSEPCGVNDAILTNIWRSAEEEGITTMFEGGGADHLFFGMNRYRGYFNLWKTYQKFPNIVYLNKFEKIFEKIQIKNLSKIQFLIKNWENGIPPYPKRKIGEVYFYNLNMERSIFELGIKKYYDNFINALGYFDLRKYFSYQTILMDPEEHFYPPSELQAIYNIFPISPYWKSDLVRLALQIPMEWKTKLFKTKYILRKSAQYYKVNKSENNNYWMKSKIGLQSPMNFIHKNSMAKEWLAALSKQILDSKEYQIIKDFNGEYPTSPERLLSFLIWNKNNPEIGLFDIT